MFESLKKKFSRTSNKLTDELKEEATKEDNIEISDEENSADDSIENEDKEEKSSFFSSFRRKKEETPSSQVKSDDSENIESSDDSNQDEAILLEKESEKDSSEENIKENKNSFFSKFKRDKLSENDKSSKEESFDADKDEDIESDSEKLDEDKKDSGFFSKFKWDKKSDIKLDSNDLESADSDVVSSAEEVAAEDDSDIVSSDEDVDGEVDSAVDSSSDLKSADSSVTHSDDEVNDTVDSDVVSSVDEDNNKKDSGFFSIFKRDKKSDADKPNLSEKNNSSEDLDGDDLDKDQKNPEVLSKFKKDDGVEEKYSDESDDVELESEDNKKENSGLLSKIKKDKSKEDSNGGKSGIFSFIKEKTISEKHVEDILWELEMGLLEGDVAIDVANVVVDSVKSDLVGQKIKRSSDIEEYTYNALKNAVSKIIDVPGKSMTEMIEDKKSKGEPLVVMFVGINGTGKTTTIGKIANFYIKKGYTPVIAASDTFRAGAIEQISHHADNLDVKIIKHQKGSDPAAVAFDAVEHAKSKGKELVLIDTAGRMQNNTNLMDEMKKINRVAKPDLVVFVGDALTGNDATEQATKFNDAIGVDGVILTKADADSKGGASLSIGYVIKKPIMFLGMGQGYDDIKEYDSDWMLNQLFSDDESDEVEAVE